MHLSKVGLGYHVCNNHRNPILEMNGGYFYYGMNPNIKYIVFYSEEMDRSYNVNFSLLFT